MRQPVRGQGAQNGEVNEGAQLKAAIQMIKNDEKWLKAVEEQAEQRGLTIEENLRRNAKYYLEQRQNKKTSHAEP